MKKKGTNSSKTINPIKRPYGPFTQYGFLFICFVIVFGISCSSSGANLLYMMLAFALCAIPINGFVAWLCVWRITVNRDFPTIAVVGTLTRLQWNIENHGWMFPAIGLEIRDIGDRSSQMLYVGRVERKKSCDISIDVVFAQRGYYCYKSLWMNTSFPFGLTQRYYKSKTGQTEILVLPPVANVEMMMQQLMIVVENRSSGIKGTGQEFYGLRDYEQGDPLNRIHWRSMAKRDTPVVKEFELTETRKAVLILEYTENDLYFERMVIACASLSSALIALGWSLKFSYKEMTPVYVNGRYGLRRILEDLALLSREDFRDSSYISPNDDSLMIRISDSDEDAADCDSVLFGINGWKLVDSIFFKRELPVE